MHSRVPISLSKK